MESQTAEPTVIDYNGQETEAAHLTDWANEPKLKDLKQDLSDAKPDHDQHVAKVDSWLEHLHITGSVKLPKKEGYSRMQPKLIRKQAEWRYPSLSEPFLNSPDVFKVSPTTWKDKLAAKQNESVLNYQFNTKLNKVELIDEFVRAAVDEGTVILRTGWKYEEEVTEEETPTYDYVISDDPAVAEKLQMLHELKQSDHIRFEQSVPDHEREAYELAFEQGMPVQAIQTGTEMVERIKVLVNHPIVEVCDYRNLVIDPTAQGDIEKANFVIYSYETSMAELKKNPKKYKNLEQINVKTAGSILSEPDHAQTDNTSFNFADDARRKFVAYEYWGFSDINGDGLLKPIVATWVANTLVHMEESPFPDGKLPFVVAPYLPVRRSMFGEPDGELLKDNQAVAGAVTRGMVDVMARGANGQQGTQKGWLDVVNRRKFQRGEDYEFNGGMDPSQGVYMHKFDELPVSAQWMLQAQSLEAESMSGVKAFASTGLSGTALGETTGNGRSVLDAASKREVSILRRLSAAMEKVARKVIAMNGVFLADSEVIRITDEEFVEIRRDDLAGEFDLKVSISTAEEEDAKASELSFMLQTVGPNADPKITFMIMSDIARLRRMPELAKRLEEFEPTPDPMAVEKARLEIELLKAQIAETQSKTIENRADANLNMAKASTEGAKAKNLDSDTDLKNLEHVEQETGTHHERALDLQGSQARANMQLKAVEHVLTKEGNTNV